MGICDNAAEIPWTCDFSDGCSHGWHLAVYDYDQTTGETITSSYNDGDWESCEPEDIPTQEEIAAAWQTYYRYVARTGLDPLGHFIVSTIRKANHKWQASFRNWIGASKFGLICTGVRRRGRGEWMTGNAIPLAVREFLELKATPGSGAVYCDGIHTLDELRKCDAISVLRVVNKMGYLFYFEIEEEQPVSPSRIAKTLKKLARNELAAVAK